MLLKTAMARTYAAYYHWNFADIECGSMKILENLRREFLSINLLAYHGRVQVEDYSLKHWELSLMSLSTNMKRK